MMNMNFNIMSAEQINYVVILNDLLKVLSEKEYSVLFKRYGLKNSRAMTLAAVGEEYAITRERVRQIQENGIKKLQRNAVNTDLVNIHEWLQGTLKDHGGLMKAQTLVDELVQLLPQESDSMAELLLICELCSDVRHEHNKVDFEPHFRFTNISFSQIKSISTKIIDVLRKEDNILSLAKLVSEVSANLGFANKKLIEACLRIDRRLSIDDRGISLISWRHINPKTLFDKINFILNNSMEPMHFSQIAEKISAEKFDGKSVSVQAVHNELINNPLFVLIGRGIYALKTWGYKEGTVSDVIESILSKKGPMHLYDLTQEVLQRRKVKPVTVQINLNSKKSKFRRTRDGLYELAN